MLRTLILCFLLSPWLLAQDLQARLAAIAGEHEGLALHVQTLDGQVLADVRGDEALMPASNVKLLTAALALETLGPDAELRTTLHRRGALRGGRLEGDLVVRGGGDPTLSSRFRRDGAGGVLYEWARQLVGMGLRSVAGDLVLDARLFDTQHRHPSWPEEQYQKWYSAGVSALNLGDGCLEVRVAREGSGVAVTLDPPLDGYRVEVDCAVTPDKAAHLLDIRLDDVDRAVTVRGRFWREAAPFVHYVAVADPTVFFGEAFATALRAEGIRLDGAVRLARADEPAAELPLLCASTTPLRVALGTLLKRSQNLYAESLFKLSGATAGHGGSFAGGAAALAEVCAAAGVEMEIADGSGLSRANAVRPRAMVELLRWVSQQPWAEDYYMFLPVAGLDGTLRRRLRGVAKGRVLAKTGTLNGVSALSGFAVVGQRTLVFSMIVNNPRLGTATARQWIDRAVESLFEE